MEFGYPGANTHLENHGVSEESFWPSFTDIMMVIVMVFLLVTVAVILNNWSLIGDLKNSIQAQKIASNLAENRQQENTTLGSKLSSLEAKIIVLNEKYEQQKASLVETQEALESSRQALSENQQKLADKAGSLSALEEKLVTLDESLAAEKASHIEAQNKLTESEKNLAKQVAALAILQKNFDTAFEQKNKLALLNKAQNSTIAENEKEQQALQQALNSSKSTIESLEKKQAMNEKEVLKLTEADALKTKVLASLQADRSDLEKKVNLLQAGYSKAQKAAAAEVALSKETQEKSKALQAKFDSLKKSQQEQKSTLQAATDSGKMTKDALQVAQNALKELEEEKQRIILSMSTKLKQSEEKVASLEATVTEIEKQIKIKDAQILALNENDGNEKLRSLQGEYDTLDAKYQKLLRPARSSKGKHVVSISYKNKSGKRVIRLKSGPDASYKTVTKSELHKSLQALKNKYKTDLYLKIIIPKTSGLSYNEAWKFTSNLQRKYDYYHQPDAKK